MAVIYTVAAYFIDRLIFRDDSSQWDLSNETLIFVYYSFINRD